MAGTLSGRRWQVWKKRIRPCVPRGGVRNDSGENKDRSEARDDEKQQTDQIVDTGSVITGDGRHMIHCLTVIGQIEGHNVLPSQNKTTKYEHVIPQLVAIEEEPRIDGLLIILNTVGGDVEAGLAIAELVAGMKKPTVSLVLGGGHSIGVPLAVAAKHSERNHDNPSSADERIDVGGSTDLGILPEDARANYAICDRQFAYYPSALL